VGCGCHVHVDNISSPQSNAKELEKKLINDDLVYHQRLISSSTFARESYTPESLANEIRGTTCKTQSVIVNKSIQIYQIDVVQLEL
jgi:hypothetical protein